MTTTQVTINPTTQAPDDIISLIQDILRRLQDLEAVANNATITAGNTSFPSGITIGAGPPVVVNTSISQVGSITYTASTYLTDGYVDVAWTTPDSTVATVEVFFALKDLTGGTYQPTTSMRPTAGTGVRVTGLIPGRTYGFYVVARNNIGIPAAPQPATGFTDVAVPLDGTIPNAATGLAFASFADSLILSWAQDTSLNVLEGGYYETQMATNSSFTTGVQDWRGSATIMSFDNLPGSGNSSVSYWARVREVSLSGTVGAWTSFNGGSAISAGGVSGADILARSIAAVSIVTGSLTANEIAANTITGGKIAANTISAGNLAALQLSVGQYIRSSNYVAGSSGWNIDQSGSAEFRNVTVQGTVSSSTITGTSISGGTITGTTYTSATGQVTISADTITIEGGAGNRRLLIGLLDTGDYGIRSFSPDQSIACAYLPLVTGYSNATGATSSSFATTTGMPSPSVRAFLGPSADAIITVTASMTNPSTTGSTHAYIMIDGTIYASGAIMIVSGFGGTTTAVFGLSEFLGSLGFGTVSALNYHTFSVAYASDGTNTAHFSDCFMTVQPF